MPQLTTAHCFISWKKVLKLEAEMPIRVKPEDWDVERLVVDHVAWYLGAFWSDRLDELSYVVRRARQTKELAFEYGLWVTLSVVTYDVEKFEDVALEFYRDDYMQEYGEHLMRIRGDD